MFGSDSATAIEPVDPTGTLPSVIGTQRRAGVGRSEDAAAGDAHVEGAGLRGNAGHGGDAPAARRADHPEAKPVKEHRVDGGEHRLAGRGRSLRLDERGKNDCADRRDRAESRTAHKEARERVGATGKLEGTRGVASGIRRQVRTNRDLCRTGLHATRVPAATADAMMAARRADLQRLALPHRTSLDSYAFVRLGVSSTALTSLLDAPPPRRSRDPHRRSLGLAVARSAGGDPDARVDPRLRARRR